MPKGKRIELLIGTCNWMSMWLRSKIKNVYTYVYDNKDKMQEK